MTHFLTLAVLALASTSAFAAPVQVTHHGTLAHGQIEWETRWFADDTTPSVAIAGELPDGSVVQTIPTLGGRTGTLRVTVPQDLDEPVLHVPFLEGRAVQRVILRGADFTPSDDLRMEKHVRYWAPEGLAGSARRDFERSVVRRGGDRAHTADQALYLRADPVVVDAGGVTGDLRPPGAVSPRVQGILGLMMVGLLALGALLYRGLDSMARAERNSAYIRRNFGDQE